MAWVGMTGLDCVSVDAVRLVNMLMVERRRELDRRGAGEMERDWERPRRRSNRGGNGLEAREVMDLRASLVLNRR